MIDRHVGRALLIARTGRMNQEDLASALSEKLGTIVTPDSINDIENGVLLVLPTMLGQICEILQVDQNKVFQAATILRNRRMTSDEKIRAWLLQIHDELTDGWPDLYSDN